MITKRFQTVDGVFIPTILSVLGVIMYLRLEWVVGQVSTSVLFLRDSKRESAVA